MNMFGDSEIEKTLVIGNDSFLGKEFYKIYKTFYPDTIGTSYKSSHSYRLDLVSPDLSQLPIKKDEYKWGLITAGISSLLKCEEDVEASRKINIEGTLCLLKQFKVLGITPIFFSSDYVFDGNKKSYDEDCISCPINEYGRQKALLEIKIRELFGNEFLILRLSKVFGSADFQSSFLDQIIISLKSGVRVNALTDQFFCPIFYKDVVDAVLMLQSTKAYGIYNLSGDEIWTRYEIAKGICEHLNISQTLIQKITVKELGLPYQLPINLILKNDKIKSKIDLTFNKLSHRIMFL